MATNQPINWNKWKDFRIDALNEGTEQNYTGTIKVTCDNKAVFDRLVALLRAQDKVSSVTPS